MNQFNTQNVGAGVQTDLGLRTFLLGTYRYMAMAMAVTATVAFFTGQAMMANPALAGLIYNPIVAIGGGVMAFLFGFAAVMGVFMSAYATAAYSPTIVAKIFFMTVAMFGALSLFGYTTKFDLSAVVKYAFAAFLGYVLIGVVGMFVPALSVFGGGMFGTIINVVALAAIAVITAWETQHLKRVYYAYANDASMKGKMQAFGAASLLLAFINMFQILMSLFGRE